MYHRLDRLCGVFFFDLQGGHDWGVLIFIWLNFWEAGNQMEGFVHFFTDLEGFTVCLSLTHIVVIVQ